MSAVSKRAAQGAVHAPAAILASAQAITVHATMHWTTHERLVRSARNVRGHQPGMVAELAALIRSQGLLQNLVCCAQCAGGRATGLLEVVAGARRMEAIGLLIAEGSLPRDYAIPYLLVTPEEAVLVSLAENLGRAPLHPAELFDAMLVLARQGRSPEDIGLAFGVDALTVRRRLKLANVAPRLFALYRQDQASYEQMAALAVSDDHAAQERAWDSLDQWSRQPLRLRRLLTAAQVDAVSDPVARFVGVAAYEAAGGHVVRDLFSEDGAGYLDDAGLLETLAAQRLQPGLALLEQEGWAWTALRVRLDAAELAQYGRVRQLERPASAAEQAEAAQLEAERARSLEQWEAAEADGNGEQAAALQDTLAELDQRLAALQAARRQDDTAQRACAGAIATIGTDGEMVLLRGLIRPQDREQEREDAEEARGDGRPAREARPVHSERLTMLLTARHTLALRAELLRQPQTALLVLVRHLVAQAFYGGAGGHALQLQGRVPALPPEARNGAAWDGVEAQRAALQALLPERAEQLMEWLQAQPQAVVLDLLAFCTAASLYAVQARERPTPELAQIAGALRLDMHAWWQPDVPSYFAHVGKARMVAVLRQAVSAAAAVPLERMGRSAAAEAAARALQGSGWLPAVLRGGVEQEQV